MSPSSSLILPMTPDPRPAWADPNGLPTAYCIASAMQVATAIDAEGSLVKDARETYWHMATGALHPPADLERGEVLLEDLGLVERRDQRLFLTPVLRVLLTGSLEAATALMIVRACEGMADNDSDLMDAEGLAEALEACVPDVAQRDECVRVALGKFDDARRRLVGEIGEEVVHEAARRELAELGHATHASAVRRVSLESDGYGYDIVAPTVHGVPRLLEVKASTSVGDSVVVYLSRHEATVGLREPAWSLLVCEVTDVELRAGNVLGWLPARSIAAQFPIDQEGGRWESVQLTLAVDSLHPGMPSPYG